MKKVLGKIKSLFWGDEKLKGGSAIFIILAVVSTVALIASNIAAGKSFSVFGWNIGGAPIVLTCGVLCFPITYVISDLMSEVYGFSASRRVTWLGFALNLFLDLVVMAAIAIPGANYYYQEIVGKGLEAGFGFDFLTGNLGSLGILAASLIAFVVGSWIDDLVFEGIKKLTKKNDKVKGKKDNGFKFCLRAIGSSFAGELIDSLIFIPLLYLFTVQFGTTITNFWQLMIIILIQVSFKTLYEILISPLTHLLAKRLKKYEAEHMSEGNVVSEQVKEIAE